jgi:ABC-type nitrate/sulfonate/bicarbonate transport system substrate-binding protein
MSESEGGMSEKRFGKTILNAAYKTLNFIVNSLERRAYRIVKAWAALFSLIFVILLSACSSVSSTPTLTPVTVQLVWTHSAQFAGLYAADQNGTYAAEGLGVSFIEGGGTVDFIAPVLNGEAQFGITAGDLLITARAEGKPLRAIATILRRDPYVFFALSESGIRRPDDFAGKTLLVWPTARPRLYAMLARVGVDPNQVTLTAEGDFTALYSGEIDVAGGYVTSEVLLAQKAGHDVKVIYPDDYGVHLYSDTIFTTDELIATNPDLVRRFLRATLKGWTYAVENPTEAGPMVVRYNPDADTDFTTEELIASLPLINTGEDPIGWMKPEVWVGMEQFLREQNVLTEPVDVTQAYTLKFLQEIYP